MLIKLLHSLYMHAISSSLKRYLNSEGNEIRSIYVKEVVTVIATYIDRRTNRQTDAALIIIVIIYVDFVCV